MALRWRSGTARIAGRFSFALLLNLQLAVAIFGPTNHARAFWKAVESAEAYMRTCMEADSKNDNAGDHVDRLLLACDARPAFTQYMLASRHLLAFTSSHLSGSSDSSERERELLTRFGELDTELSQLTLASKAGKPYFWHGPKRHLPVKLQELLDFPLRTDNSDASLRSLLQKAIVAPVAEEASAQEMALPPLGLAYPTKAKLPVDLGSTSLLVGSGTSDDSIDVCALSARAVEAGLRQLVLRGVVAGLDWKPKQSGSCIAESLEVTLDVSDHFDRLLELGGRRRGDPLLKYIETMLAAYGLPSFTLVALPARAFTEKRLKSFFMDALTTLRESGLIKGVALSGPVTVKKLKSILSQSVPPSQWLVEHDDCRPMSTEALRAAIDGGMLVVAHGEPCGSLLQHVAERESLSTTTLMHRWSAELGMAFAIAPQSVADFSEELKRVQNAPPLSSESWRLLSGSAMLTRTASQAAVADIEDTFGLREVLRRCRDLATASLQDSETQNLAKGHLDPSVWATLKEDQQAFDDNFNIIYKPHFLSQEVYERVMAERDILWKTDELEKNCNLDGTNRIGGYVLDSAMRNTSLYQLFYGSEEFRQWISRINGHLMFPSDFPVELREYPEGSRGMPCHRDLLMFTNATLDLEFVYTIDNFGTCISTYTDRKGKVHEVHTEANSLIMVRPNAALHCVKASTGGYRTILKFIYVGDYHKSNEFVHYIQNECGNSNPNVKVLKKRRESARELEL
eukprot:TRINITY_DN22721_c0_g2_i1.p1 TRINITY_DN22721_c0_g2~~TRINITY_DN22721_c0_g2_i1.p1  ORF type:complete len:741 (-),score=126.77 TRINITY_DN22721_c0_g2_i1:56-2278(-)